MTIWAKYALFLQRGKRERRTSVTFKWGICCEAAIRFRLFNPNKMSNVQCFTVFSERIQDELVARQIKYHVSAELTSKHDGETDH